MSGRWLLLLVLLCQGACGGSPGEDAGPDGGAGVRPAALDVRVGGGSTGTFQEVIPGAALLLQRGCQGSQHIFTALRARGAAPGALRVSVSVHRSADGALVSVPLDVRLTPEPDPDEADAVRLTGLTPVIEAPREVLGQEVTLTARVSDSARRRGEASLRGVVRWGPDSCGGAARAARPTRGPLEEDQLLLWLGQRAAAD